MIDSRQSITCNAAQLIFRLHEHSWSRSSFRLHIELEELEVEINAGKSPKRPIHSIEEVLAGLGIVHGEQLWDQVSDLLTTTSEHAASVLG